MEGVSITLLGSPRQHVWNYAVGLSEDGTSFTDSNCPCAAVTIATAPVFVRDNCYCESGNEGNFDTSFHYTIDPLWGALILTPTAVLVVGCHGSIVNFLLLNLKTVKSGYVRIKNFQMTVFLLTKFNFMYNNWNIFDMHM